mgnify:FL=1|jgi:hypothetical protein|tara:strand:- start:180 stop:644 length:465 start_codon:yes stop_codon:yes gene_type:complete
MSQLTDVYVNKEDLGKNLYRKKTYYTLCIEQDCLATNQDDADKKMSECGIEYDKINKEITEEKDGVETYMVDANYTDSDKTEYLGKVVYDDYDGLENAKENGDVEISTYADETDVINDKGEVVSEAENDCNSIQKSIDDLDKVEAKADKESVPF